MIFAWLWINFTLFSHLNGVNEAETLFFRFNCSIISAELK